MDISLSTLEPVDPDDNDELRHECEGCGLTFIDDVGSEMADIRIDGDDYGKWCPQCLAKRLEPKPTIDLGVRTIGNCFDVIHKNIVVKRYPYEHGFRSDAYGKAMGKLRSMLCNQPPRPGYIEAGKVEDLARYLREQADDAKLWPGLPTGWRDACRNAALELQALIDATADLTAALDAPGAKIKANPDKFIEDVKQESCGSQPEPTPTVEERAKWALESFSFDEPLQGDVLLGVLAGYYDVQVAAWLAKEAKDES